MACKQAVTNEIRVVVVRHEAGGPARSAPRVARRRQGNPLLQISSSAPWKRYIFLKARYARGRYAPGATRRAAHAAVS